MRAARRPGRSAERSRPRPGWTSRAGTLLADKGAHLDQRPDALLQKERVALGPLDQELQRLHRRVCPQEGGEQLVGALLLQRIDADLGVEALLPQVWVYSGR